MSGRRRINGGSTNPFDAIIDAERAGMAASKIPVVGAIKQAMHMRDARKKVRMYRNMRD